MMIRDISFGILRPFLYLTFLFFIEFYALNCEIKEKENLSHSLLLPIDQDFLTLKSLKTVSFKAIKFNATLC